MTAKIMTFYFKWQHSQGKNARDTNSQQALPEHQASPELQEILSCESDWGMEQLAQRGWGVSTLWDIQKQSWHSHEQLALCGRAWAGSGWTRWPWEIQPQPYCQFWFYLSSLLWWFKWKQPFNLNSYMTFGYKGLKSS